jgi:hypothetical protein
MGIVVDTEKSTTFSAFIAAAPAGNSPQSGCRRRGAALISAATRLSQTQVR